MSELFSKHYIEDIKLQLCPIKSKKFFQYSEKDKCNDWISSLPYICKFTMFILIK